MTQPHATPSPLQPDLPLLQPELPGTYVHDRDYQSYSSVDTYCRCPLAYKARYIDRHIDPRYVEPVPDPHSPAELGTLLHRCLELSVQQLWSRRHKGPVAKHAALFHDRLNAAFLERPHASAELLIDAQEILQAWLPTESVYADQIRGLEWPFELLLEDSEGDILIKGFIDRLEITPEQVVRIKDYKSSRLLFTRDELRRNLQASIYELAVRDSQALNLDAETPVESEFVMLRHGIVQRTTRTPEQLNRAFTLVVGIVRRIQRARAFPPQLNKYCAYCEHRLRCPLWIELLKRGLPEVYVDPMDLTAIAEEYERLTNASKCLYRRKEEMGDLMRIHLIGHDSIETRQHVYRLSRSTETEFTNPHLVVSQLARAYNRTIPEVMHKIASIRKTEYDKLIGALAGRLTIQERKELEALLAQTIETHAAPKLQAYKAPTSTGEPAKRLPRTKTPRRRKN